MPGRSARKLWLKASTGEVRVWLRLLLPPWRCLISLSGLSAMTMSSSSASKFWSIKSNSGEDEASPPSVRRGFCFSLTRSLVFQTRVLECSAAAAHQRNADEVASVSGTLTTLTLAPLTEVLWTKCSFIAEYSPGILVTRVGQTCQRS